MMARHAWAHILMLWALAEAFPSFRARIPNGDRVPCGPGMKDCQIGDPELGQPASVCFGLGHATCGGGTFPLNSWGRDFKAAGYQWTRALCEKDSDNDGFSNGDELGDPCCEWALGDLPSLYMSKFAPSHPGITEHMPAQSYTRPACGTADVAPAFKSSKVAAFRPGEVQKSIVWRIKDYKIPSRRTTYVDFVFNFDDDAQDLFHIVYAEAIVEQPRHLHHFVVKGCAELFPDALTGMPLRRGQAKGCGIPLGGFAAWAPGSTLWPNPEFVGTAIGKGVGIKAIHIQVHFTDGDTHPGTISRDGIKMYYTPTLREMEAVSTSTIQVGRNPFISIPPGKDRYFLTRTCEVEGICKDVDDIAVCSPDIPVTDVYFHAHLLGAEMWQELTKADTGQTIDLGSQPIWHFDDQAHFNLQTRNITIKNGDVIQSTCVWNSTSRSESTRLDIETVDEMCFTVIGSYTKRGGSGGSSLSAGSVIGGKPLWTCKDNGDGVVWAGELQVGESARGIGITHPSRDAMGVWEARDGETGRPVSLPPKIETESTTLVPPDNDTSHATIAAVWMSFATPSCLLAAW